MSLGTNRFQGRASAVIQYKKTPCQALQGDQNQTCRSVGVLPFGF